jgi:hypothetical protein
VRPGTRLTAAARQLKLGKPLHRGLNYWYIVHGSTSNDVLKVRHGVIEEVGIANKSLTSTCSSQLQLLSSF